MAKIEKIYKITLEGESELLSKMNAVNKTFEETKKRFKEVKDGSKGIFINSQELQDEKDNLHQVTIELVKQQQESKRLQAETVALKNAKRALSNEELKEQQSVLKTYEAYQKLQKQYLNAKKEAQGLGAQYGVNSSQFKVAAAEAQKYYQKLISLDKAVGVYTRNVGNYPNQAARYFSESIKKNFDDMKGQMTQFAVGYLSFQGLMNVGGRIKNDVIAFDSYNNAIEAVSQKTGDLAVNQKFVIDLSDRLGTKLLETGNSFKSFYAAYTESGGGAQQARDIYESAAESAAVLKLSQDQANGVMLAFSQIASKGKVQAEELRGQIGERIPGAFGIAARAMGVTTAELDKMMANGKLASQDFLPKFARELKNTFGNGGKEVQGMQAQLGRLDNIISKIGSNKSFISAVSTTITLVTFLATAITKVPFSVWLSFVGLLTLAYWSNIQAMMAKNVQLGVWIVRMGVGNALIVTATAIERAHAIVLGIVNGAYQVLIITMNLMGISTARLRTAWISFNSLLSATPWGLIIGLIFAAGAATVAFAQKTDSATSKLKQHGQTLKDNAALLRVTSEINKQVSETISGQMSKIASLTAIINNNNLSLETRKRALDQLIAINPKYLDGLTLENFHTAQGTKILDAYKNKLMEVARAKAASALYEQKSKELFELEFSLNDKKTAKTEADKYKNNVFDSRSWGEFGKGIGGMIGLGDGDAEDQLNKTTSGISKLKQEISSLGNIVAGNKLKGINEDDTILGGGMGTGELAAASNSLKALEEEIKDLTERWKAASVGSKEYYDLQTKLKQKQAYYDSLTKDKKTKEYKGARLTGNQKDYLKDLEADKNQELAIIEKSFVDGKILEDEYIKKSLAVNQTFFTKKIAYLKGGNAEERKQVAQAELDKIKAIKDSNDKLYAFYKKQNDDELKDAEALAQRKRDVVINDIYATDQDKVAAEQTYYEESSTAQLEYNQKMIDLEIQLSKNMIEEANERSRVLQDKVDKENANRLQSRIQSLDASLKLVDRTKEELDNTTEINNAFEKRNILENKKMTLAQKNLELQKLAARLELDNINVELGSVNAKIMFMTWEITQRKLTNDELQKYNNLLKEKAVLEGNKASAEQGVRTSGGSLSSPGSGTSELSGFFTDQFKNGDGIVSMGKDKNGNDVDGSALLGEVISQSFDTATLAMNNYFDAERNRIEQSKQLAYERIELEQQQSLRYAQSKDEETAINKEAAEKKKQADKEAGERLKKIKKQELKIALATQLANIGVAAAQNPLNGITFGGAGIAMYSILAALAFAQYFSNLSSISSAQYKKGGRFKKFAKGGLLGGPSHSNGGMPVINPVTGQKVAEMEGDEGIINKKSMADNNTYTITGKPSQIASKINAIGGGVDWLGGATLSKFQSGGLFNWNRIQPPVFNAQRQQFQSMDQNTDYTSERLDRTEAMLESLAKEQYKKVVVSSKEISKQQRETEKQTEIGTL